jgi:serine/threonine protein kinase
MPTPNEECTELRLLGAECIWSRPQSTGWMLVISGIKYVRKVCRNAAAVDAQLRHVNVVAHRVVSGYAHAVMPYVSGGDLETVMRGRGPFAVAASADDAQAVCCITRLVLAGLHYLHYLHQQRITHRDLKPSNILVVHAGVGGVVSLSAATFMLRGSLTSSARCICATARRATHMTRTGTTTTGNI